MTLVTETPILKKDCQVPECKKAPKGFKTSRGLKGHMEKFHQIVIDVLSPVADTARVLFSENQNVSDMSTQGNSHGAVNSPKVISEGVFLCGNCNETCNTNKAAMNHNCDGHDSATAANKAHNPVDFEETEEIDLVESLEETEICLAANIVKKNSSI